MVDDAFVTNQSNQSVEGCVPQQAREHLNSVIVERNGSVEPNGKQLEHGALEKLDETGRHEITEITAFHEHVDRDTTIGNQNYTVGGVATEIPEGCSTNGTTHSQRRSEGNHIRTSLLSLKIWSGWFNCRKKRRSQYLKR